MPSKRNSEHSPLFVGRVCALLLSLLPALVIHTPRPAAAAMAQTSALPDRESVLEIAEDEDGEVGIDQGEKPPEASNTPRHTQLDGLLGYRLFSRDGFGGRAAPYEDLRPGPTGGLLFNNLDRKLKYSLEGTFTSEKDYLGDFLFDHNGDYRFHLRTESLWHNLDQKPLFSPDFKLGRADSASLADYIASPDPAAAYGLRVEQDLARARIKIHEWPLHLNLGYWRLLREGTAQFRYADHAFEGPTNTVYGRSRAVNRETHEGEAGFDAHLGPIDLIYSFLIREFRDNAGIPRDPFVMRPDTAGTLVRGAGLQQHNEAPDSRFLAHTVKAHTSLSGGLVAAASYTYGKRQNRSALTDIRGADGVSQVLNNVAGDLTYTPCKEFTLAVKYRRQEIDSDTPSTITSSFALPSTTIPVRHPIDTRKDVLTTTLTIHPTPLATVKGEYRGLFINRDLVRDPDIAVGWKLPENSRTHRGSVTFLSRPVKGLRLKAQYSYMADENPSYDTSPDERHDGELLLAYTMPNRWGANANYQARRESRGEIGRTELFAQVTPQQTLQFTTRPFQTLLAREQASDTVTVSVWFMPVERVTISGGYALLRSRAEQGVLLTSVGSAQAPLTQDTASYTSQAQVWSLGAGYRPVDPLDLSLQLQHIRSLADFSPVNTAGIGEISRSSTEESSLAARADYRFTRNFSCTLHYGLRDYNDRVSTRYEGTVHSVTAFLTATW